MIVIERQLDHNTLAADLRGAFKPDVVHRVEFQAGLSLYKVTESGAATPQEIAVDALGRVTPWWVTLRDPQNETVSIRGVADVVESAGRAGAGLKRYLRTRGAVCHDWNLMTHVLVIALRRRVIGLMGTCSGQPLFHDRVKGRAKTVDNVRFIGGEQQFYPPGLRVADVRVIRFGSLA